MKGWLLICALIVLPGLAFADCGWFLMAPTIIDPRGEPRGWQQNSAFDSAKACEEDRGIFDFQDETGGGGGV
jgi:hypothetical protein